MTPFPSDPELELSPVGLFPLPLERFCAQNSSVDCSLTYRPITKRRTSVAAWVPSFFVIPTLASVI